MKVNLITYTPNAEQLVAAAAKLCYSKSEIKDLMDNLTADKVESFLKRLTDMGHQSPFEHISFTFGVEDVSRSLLAQLTRHRMASYSVQSQRYVHDSFGYVTPPEIANDEYLNSFYQDILDNVYIAYEHLAKHLQDRYVSEGMKEKDAEKKAIEDARYVLPNACCTRLMVTMNARELMHFFNQRCCCYDNKTEVLTTKGWKLFKDVSKTDILYTLNTESQEVEFYNPTEIFQYDYNNDMYYIKGQSVDLAITPNHNVLASSNYQQPFVLLPMSDVKEWDYYRFKKNCQPIKGKHSDVISLNGLSVPRRNQYGECWSKEYDAKSIDTHILFRLLGFYLSDGYAIHSKHRSIIGFCKGDLKVIQYYADVLKSISSSQVRVFKDKNVAYKVEVDDPVLYQFFEPLGKAYDKRIPEWVWEYDSSYLEDIYYGMRDGDFAKDGSTLSTVSLGMADDLQRLALHIGYSATVTKYDRRGEQSVVYTENIPKTITSKHISYYISFNYTKNEPRIKTKKRNPLSIAPYNGIVYCVEVPNHTLYVRRNGKTCWSGNSRAQWEIREMADQMLKQVKEVAPHIFAKAGAPCTYGVCTEGVMSCGNPRKELK